MRARNRALAHPAERQFHEFLGIVAAVVVGVLLRPDQADAGDRLAVDKVLLIGFVPAVDRFDGAVLAAIFAVGADVVPPRLDRARKPFEHPQPGLGLGLARLAEGRLARLVHGHALGDQLVPAEQAVDELAGLAVLLEAARVRAGLVIEHEDLGPAADFLEVAETAALPADRAAVHADPEAIRPARGFGRAIVRVPDLQPPRVVPLDPLAIDRIVPVLLAGNLLARRARGTSSRSSRNSRCFRAQSAPAIVGDPLGMRALDDLRKMLGMYSS